MADPVVAQPNVQQQATPNLMQSSKQVAEQVAPKPVETPKPTEAAKPVEQKIESPQVTSADILKRTSAKVEPTKQESVEELQGQLDDIKDPVAKALVEKKIKDLESGYNKKYQTLAQQRKELEDLKAKISTWTPERLAEEMRNPAFVQAAQLLQQSAPPQDWAGSNEEWSSLSPTEKQQFQAMRQETQSLQTQVQKMLQAQEDVEIKKIYPDFEPQVVDEAIEGLRTGKITASRADIWKVVNHDKNVEKGYQFGYEDGYKKALEKLNGNTHIASNISMSPSDEVPDEVRKGGFSSIALWRLGRSKNGSQKK